MDGPTIASAMMLGIPALLVAMLVIGIVIKRASKSRRNNDRRLAMDPEGPMALEYASWTSAFAPYRWKGRISSDDESESLDIEFDGPVSHESWMTLYGASGMGGLNFLGSTNDIVLKLDMNEADRVGVLDALRVSRDAARFALLLDADAERALGDLSGRFSGACDKTFEVSFGLKVAWCPAGSNWGPEHGPTVEDRSALIEDMMALKKALFEREEDVPDAAALLELSRARDEISSTLAARALLAGHPGTPEARAVAQERARGGARDRELLMGWAIDRIDGIDQGTPEWCAARVRAIVRADPDTGTALARHARSVVNVDELIEEARRTMLDEVDVALAAELAEELDEDIDGDIDDEVAELLVRDAHLFACFMIGSFAGEGAEGFGAVYRSLVRYVKHGFEQDLEFADAMGDLDFWALEARVEALGLACHDDVYTYWANGLHEVWSQELAQRLVGVVEARELAAAGLIMIIDECEEHGYLRMLEPARLAVARLEDHWLTDDEEKAGMRDALEALEAAAKAPIEEDDRDEVEDAQSEEAEIWRGDSW